MLKDNDNLSKTGIFVCPRSAGFPSLVRSFVGDLRHQKAQNAENRPRSNAVPSLVRSFVGDLQRQKTQNAENRPRSLTVVSPVPHRCVPGLRGLRPWSVVLSGTCDTRRHRMPKTVPGQGKNCGPGTETPRTGDGKRPDLRRKPYGPGTVLQIRHFLPIFVIYKREVLHA